MGGIGLIMLNRLPQNLAGTRAFGLELGMAATQLLWFGVGIVAMLVIAIGLRDHGILRHYKYTWAAIGILLLAGTILFGYEVNGARLWVNLGPVSVQPGELMKIVLVIFIAGYLAETRTLLTSARMRIGFLSIPPLPYFLPMLALFAIVMLIVVRLNDLGTALLFFGIFLTMLFVATGRRSYVLIGLLLFVAGSSVAYQLFGHVQVRLNVWLDPFADPLGAGFQPVRALYALGRGGIFGEGLGQGLVTLGGNLTIPFVHTDFIFTAIAEELGLLGAFALLGFSAVLVFRGLRIAALARDDFGGLLAVGLTDQPGPPDADHHRRQHEAHPADRHHPAVRELRRLERTRQLHHDRPAPGGEPPERDRDRRGAGAVIATNVRRLGFYLMLSFALVSGSVVWWQVHRGAGPRLAGRQPRGHRRSTQPAARHDLRRRRPGARLVGGDRRAEPPDLHRPGLHPRHRLRELPLRQHRHRACLRGPARRADRSEPAPRPRQRHPRPPAAAARPDPDHRPRLQDLAAAELGSDVGAVVALDPATGASWPWSSSPTFDATPISGDPDVAQEPMDALRADPAEPLLARHAREPTSRARS
jgi:cell division protein FtsW (lipid II flippase)